MSTHREDDIANLKLRLRQLDDLSKEKPALFDDSNREYWKNRDQEREFVQSEIKRLEKQ